MSVVHDQPVVLLREPVRAAVRRLASRAALPALAAVAWIIGFETWANVVVTVAALPSAILLVLGIGNLIMNQRVLLVHREAGAIERPLSLQEMMLKRGVEHVGGREVYVMTDVPSISGAPSDPRVTLFLVGSEGAPGSLVSRVPLWGLPVADFIERSNALLAGRGTTLVLRESGPVEVDETPEEPKEFDWPEEDDQPT
ncbi:MAG: hypothetical protein CVT64_05390 [Actinobacteria bacterium HGW-Actinobacteria-4]|nr:MAG: hypothetical protein CVT64_05390 [Actinobacteria bacterium HGW-Actinobacteria-4]